MDNKCILIDDEKGLDKLIKSKKKLFVMFYASWCPYSQRFLPEFIENSKTEKECHARIVIDDLDSLSEKYNIEVYPTVLYFENGKVSKRLDAEFHKGLNSSQLKDFVEVCVNK